MFMDVTFFHILKDILHVPNEEQTTSQVCVSLYRIDIHLREFSAYFQSSSQLRANRQVYYDTGLSFNMQNLHRSQQADRQIDR